MPCLVGGEMMNSSARKKSLEMKREGQKRRPKVSRFNYSFPDEVQMQECDPLASLLPLIPPPPSKKARSPPKIPDVSSSNRGRSSHLQSQFTTHQTIFPGLVFLQVSDMRENLPGQIPTLETPENPHWGEAVQLPSVREGL